MTQQPDTIQRPRPCGEDEFFAHPDDPVDRLGRLFVALGVYERHGITFERWLEMVESGLWAECVA